jgi:hypothetical protein
MKRRDLLCTLGAVGAVTAAGRLRDPAVAGGQSFPTVSGRSITDTLASRLAASIQSAQGAREGALLRNRHTGGIAAGSAAPDLTRAHGGSSGDKRPCLD